MLILNQGGIVYPSAQPTVTNGRIPQDVRSDLNEAKRCFGIGAWRACAVMARRCMQTAALQMGVTKGNLVDQIKELRAQSKITADLADWATEVRLTGNDAAHPGGDVITEQDASDVLELAEQLLEVIFVAPALAKEHRARRGR